MRTVVAHYFYSKKYIKEDFDKVINSLSNIANLENQSKILIDDIEQKHTNPQQKKKEDK